MPSLDLQLCVLAGLQVHGLLSGTYGGSGLERGAEHHGCPVRHTADDAAHVVGLGNYLAVGIETVCVVGLGTPHLGDVESLAEFDTFACGDAEHAPCEFSIQRFEPDAAESYGEAFDDALHHTSDAVSVLPGTHDAVVHLRNGSYGLVEIKLGGDKLIEEGVKTLNALEDGIDTDKMKAPSFKMVLTGIGDYAYRRPDGIYVVPIGCLKD